MANLPADLPTNWTQGQIISPNGTEVGLSEQYGYNYLNEQVNNTQTEVNSLSTAQTSTQQQVNTLNTQVGNIQGQVTTQGQSITALQQTTTTQGQSITSLQSQVSSNDTDIAGLQQTTTTQGQNITTLQGQVSTLNQTTTTQGENISALETEVDDLKNSVSDGKTLVANAITAKGVTTATTATFQTMANNISSISTMPSSLSSYRVPASSGPCSIGYTLVHSKTFNRPIICVTVYASTGSDGSKTFLPIWGKTFNGSMTMTNFTKTSYNKLPGNPIVETPDENLFADSYIKFSSDSKTIYLYVKSLWEGTYRDLDNSIKVYY